MVKFDANVCGDAGMYSGVPRASKNVQHGLPGRIMAFTAHYLWNQEGPIWTVNRYPNPNTYTA